MTPNGWRSIRLADVLNEPIRGDDRRKARRFDRGKHDRSMRPERGSAGGLGGCWQYDAGPRGACSDVEPERTAGGRLSSTAAPRRPQAQGETRVSEPSMENDRALRGGGTTRFVQSHSARFLQESSIRRTTSGWWRSAIGQVPHDRIAALLEDRFHS